jgi:hypothetical protein
MIAIDLILPFTFFILPISYIVFEKCLQWNQQNMFSKEISWHEHKLKTYHGKNQEFFHHKRCVPTINDEDFGNTGKWIESRRRDFHGKNGNFKNKKICAMWQNFCDRNNIYSYPYSIEKLKTIPETTLSSDEEEDNDSFVFYF